MNENTDSTKLLEFIKSITPEEWERIGQNLFDACIKEICARLIDQVMEDAITHASAVLLERNQP